MELFLNSAWALVALVSVALWLRLGQRGVTERRTSFVALLMLIVILFPVISVSDDLWSIQNPAETDTCQRRNHLDATLHCLIPVIAALPEAVFAALTTRFQRLDTPLNTPLLALQCPALDSIQNRPPPTA